MVIPVVGGGVIVVLADLALALMMLTAGLLALAFVYWLLANVRGRVAGLPVIGGTVANIITLAILTTQAVASGVSNVMQLQLHYIVHNLRIVLNYFLAPLFMPIWNQLQGLSNRVWDYDNNAFPRIAATFTSVLDHIRHYDFEVFPAIAATLVTLTNDATLLGRTLFPLVTRVEGLAGRVADYDQNAFPRIAARFAADAVALAELQAFLPLLRTLQGFESGTVRGIEGVARDVAGLRDVTGTLERDLARVLPLAVVAAIGATAILNLERVARDPCHCLTVGDFSDLPDRIASLETMGT